MKPTLNEFLRATDLDELLSLRQKLGDVDETDQEIIAGLLIDWADTQAVANLLMYPRLIPRGQVLRHLLSAFRDDNSYLALAAIVGIQPLGDGFFTAGHQEQLVDILIEKLSAPEFDIVQRASVTLVGFIKADDMAKLALFFNHDDESVRHNVVVAHVNALGLPATVEVLREVLANRPLADASRQFLETRLAEAIEVAADSDPERKWRSNLVAPLLGYIPNLSAWKPPAN